MLGFGCPAADCLKHFTLDLIAFVTDGRMVESLENVVDDLVNRYTGIFPSIENAAVDFCISIGELRMW